MSIDHEQRRADIARVTIDLVAREGLAAATIRHIAAEGGWSTASITNYFIDKQELLAWSFRLLSLEGERTFEAALDACPQDPLPALLTMIPWCPANVRRWKAYLSFWDGAVRDPELAALLAGSTRAGSELLMRLVRMTGVNEAESGKATDLLSAMIQGLALTILVDAESWDEARIRSLLADMLDRI